MKTSSQRAAIVAVAIGILVLAGWALDIHTLRSIVPGSLTMKANTALAFCLSGVSLWLICNERGSRLIHGIAFGCAFGVILIGTFTIAEYLLNTDLRIDRMLIDPPQDM